MKDLLKPLSKLGDEEKLVKAKNMRSQAYFADRDWLIEAQQAQAFKAGDQWTESEKREHKALGRESMVFNYVHPTVELLTGVLIQNPVDIRVEAQETQDNFLAEIMNILADWVEVLTDAEELDAEAFEDSIVTGKGFRSVDVQPRPENPTEVLFVEECVPFWQVRKDPGSRNQSGKDARFWIIEKWVSLEDFKIRYPEHASKVADIFYQKSETLSTNHPNYDFLDPSLDVVFDDYTDGFVDYYDAENLRVLVVQVEYYENYTRYHWVDPENPAETKEVAKEQAKLFPQDQIIKTSAKKVMWLHFTNDFILFDDESPLMDDEYQIVPMYAYADKKRKITQYYGVVKPMIDPQRECNKRVMQAIRLMANQGIGVYAEADAFVSLDQAQETWPDPEQITLVKKGQIGNIQEKTGITFPAAAIQMHEVSKDSMKQISGINPDMMGIREKEEPGIVIKLRQQASMTIISKLYNNHKKMKKELRKRRVYLIQKYMPDWQIAKIIGESETMMVKDGLVIDKENQLVAPVRALRDMKYNLKYAETSGNITKTMAELAIFLDMVGKGFPVDPNVIIDKLDLPETEKVKWKKYVDDGKQSQQQAAQAGQQLQQAQVQGKMQADAAKAQSEGQKTQIAGQKIQIDAMVMQSKQALGQKNLQLESMKAQADIQMEQMKLEAEIKSKADAAKIKRAEVLFKYKELDETKQDNQRAWVLALGDDERKNLEQDLKLLGLVNRGVDKESNAETKQI